MTRSKPDHRGKTCSPSRILVKNHIQLSLYHYWRSSCSWRVRWALDMKGVPYESVPVNILTGEQGAESHLQRNPAGFLPAIKVKGAFYGESLAILEWIEESWPEPRLLPLDPLERLRVRQLALTIVAGIQPLQNLATLKYYASDDAARKLHAQHFISKGFKTYEALLFDTPRGAFSFGNSISMADICLVPQVYNAKRFDVDLHGTPRIQAIYEACLATTACAESHPSRQPGATP